MGGPDVQTTLKLLKQISKALSVQFGQYCEIVIYDLKVPDIACSAIHIENSNVTHRTLGDSPSHIVLGDG